MLRTLIIMVGDRQHASALTFGDCREKIAGLPDSDLPHVRIWRVYSNGEPSTDATDDFAADWLSRLGPTDAIPPFLLGRVPQKARA